MPMLGRRAFGAGERRNRRRIAERLVVVHRAPASTRPTSPASDLRAWYTPRRRTPRRRAWHRRARRSLPRQSRSRRCARASFGFLARQDRDDAGAVGAARKETAPAVVARGPVGVHARDDVLAKIARERLVVARKVFRVATHEITRIAASSVIEDARTSRASMPRRMSRQIVNGAGYRSRS